MRTIAYSELNKEDQLLLEATVARLHHSLNKVSNPQTSAVAVTKNARYYGNNIFLSNCTLFCAEAIAVASAVAANDSNITKIYLAVGRADKKPDIISPCGNCRQILHDFSRLNSTTIDIFSTTSNLEEVMITNSDELLPEGFKSASLGKMAK